MTYSNVLSGFRCISTKTPPENPRTRFARHTKRSTLYRRASKSTRIFKTLARVKLMTYFCSLSFVFRTGEAWPTEMRGCDMDAHPSTARARHGIPKKSTNTKIYVSWANHNASHVPNTNENDPNRKMDPGLQLASLEYCSGCRMVISIEHEVKDSQFLITSSRGSFFEQGAYLNGDPAGLRGTDCDFRRYNVRRAMDKHHLIWTAPQLTGSQADKTVFKITASGGKSASFVQSEFLLERNDAINVWGNNTSPGHAPLREDNLIVKVFCWLTILVILCLFCLKCTRSSKGSQSFWSKVSLLHYHKLEPIHMSVEESIELHAISRADSKVEVNTDA